MSFNCPADAADAVHGVLKEMADALTSLAETFEAFNNNMCVLAEAHSKIARIQEAVNVIKQDQRGPVMEYLPSNLEQQSKT